MKYKVQDIEHPAITELGKFPGYRMQNALDDSGNNRSGVIMSASPLIEGFTAVTLDTNTGVHVFAFRNVNPITGVEIHAEVIRSREVSHEEFMAHYEAQNPRA